MDKKVIFILVGIAVVLILGFNLGLFSIDSARSCSLGSWTVQSYDIETQTVTISAGFGSVTNGGCLGTYVVTSYDLGALNINNKEFCESFFGQGSWNNEFGYCILKNENWFDDKEVKSKFGSCEYNNEGRATYTQDYQLSFDGIVANFGWSKPQLHDSISCSGGFIVGYKTTTNKFYRLENNQCNEVNILISEKTEDDYQTLSECISNLQIINNPPVNTTSNVTIIFGDLNKNGILEKSELTDAINKWYNGQYTREQLGIVISNWAKN